MLQDLANYDKAYYEVYCELRESFSHEQAMFKLGLRNDGEHSSSFHNSYEAMKARKEKKDEKHSL